MLCTHTFNVQCPGDAPLIQVFIVFCAHLMQADASITGFTTSLTDALMSGNTEAGISDASSLDEIDQSTFNSKVRSFYHPAYVI
jgi:hypothetical protein